jgi:CDP-diacylglycerol--glycerol-3-phosphate 3-phosphatidyltransferase
LSRPDDGAAGEGDHGDAGAVAPPGLVNIANALTVLRLALVPVFVLLLLAGGSGWRIAAFATFGIASITDLLDGELARRRSLITDFGKIADPIADKALTGSALVTLSVLGQLPWWITGVILFRELTVTGLRFWVIRQGVIAASRGGKVKTLLQVIAISLYVLPGHLVLAREIAMAAAVLVTVITGGDYVVRAVRLHRAVPHNQPPHGPETLGAETHGAETHGAETHGAHARRAQAREPAAPEAEAREPAAREAEAREPAAREAEAHGTGEAL